MPGSLHHDDDEFSIRGAYEAQGVEGFYRDRGAAYRNPHEPIIRRSLRMVVPGWKLDLSRVLDLAAGSGEATIALRELGAAHVDATDPYTYQAYARRTGSAAERLTFEDIAAGALADRSYTLIVCSFAMHLCEPSRLPGLAYALSLTSPALLILTPHKRPEMRPAWGWELAQEKVVERVRSRLYRSTRERGRS